MQLEPTQRSVCCRLCCALLRSACICQSSCGARVSRFQRTAPRDTVAALARTCCCTGGCVHVARRIRSPHSSCRQRPSRSTGLCARVSVYRARLDCTVTYTPPPCRQPLRPHPLPHSLPNIVASGPRRLLSPSPPLHSRPPPLLLPCHLNPNDPEKHPPPLLCPPLPQPHPPPRTPPPPPSPPSLLCPLHLPPRTSATCSALCLLVTAATRTSASPRTLSVASASTTATSPPAPTAQPVAVPGSS